VRAPARFAAPASTSGVNGDVDEARLTAYDAVVASFTVTCGLSGRSRRMRSTRPSMDGVSTNDSGRAQPMRISTSEPKGRAMSIDRT
jgi:hypothetical protein